MAKLSKKELLEYANSLPDDAPDPAEGESVYVVKVKKDDPQWGWLFGGGDSAESEAEEGEEGEAEEAEDKNDPKPKPRNRYFGG